MCILFIGLGVLSTVLFFFSLLFVLVLLVLWVVILTYICICSLLVFFFSDWNSVVLKLYAVPTRLHSVWTKPNTMFDLCYPDFCLCLVGLLFFYAVLDLSICDFSVSVHCRTLLFLVLCCMMCCCRFLFILYGGHQNLHSFPPRRSPVLTLSATCLPQYFFCCLLLRSLP